MEPHRQFVGIAEFKQSPKRKPYLNRSISHRLEEPQVQLTCAIRCDIWARTRPLKQVSVVPPKSSVNVARQMYIMVRSSILKFVNSVFLADNKRTNESSFLHQFAYTPLQRSTNSIFTFARDIVFLSRLLRISDTSFAMAESLASSTPSKETTFRSYTKDQGKLYAQARFGYNKKLYKTIIDFHSSNGGSLNTVLDVGCGPGTAAREIAPFFEHIIAIDPSEGMIATARSLDGPASIRFELSSAEELGANLSPPIPDGSVDLIIAATAAHWFDMSGFWPRAAKVLKPGGTVALWSTGGVQVDPSMPNSEAIQAALTAHEAMLKDYMVPGNILTRELYVGMPLPWTLPTPVPQFDESSFVRKEWNTPNATEPKHTFFSVAPDSIDLDTMEKILGTGSPVTRWREANPDLVGTDKDVVKIIRKNIENVMKETPGDAGPEMLKAAVGAVLLMVKKKQEP
jgi:trans-aconitate 3-methyltransferase